MSYLWIYTSIAGALLGAACLAYIRETKLGLWGYKQFDRMVDWLRDRYGLTWFDQPEDAWKKVSPKIAKIFLEGYTSSFKSVGLVINSHGSSDFAFSNSTILN